MSYLVDNKVKFKLTKESEGKIKLDLQKDAAGYYNTTPAELDDILKRISRTDTEAIINKFIKKAEEEFKVPFELKFNEDFEDHYIIYKGETDIMDDYETRGKLGGLMKEYLFDYNVYSLSITHELKDIYEDD